MIAPQGEVFLIAERRRVKAADITEETLLDLLGRDGIGNENWHFIWNLAADLVWFPERVVTAKLRRLRDRGLVDGCDCGCRGDWHLTPTGLVYARDLSFGTLPTPGFGAWR